MGPFLMLITCFNCNTCVERLHSTKNYLAIALASIVLLFFSRRHRLQVRNSVSGRVFLLADATSLSMVIPITFTHKRVAVT
jgi:hypothetical protein